MNNKQLIYSTLIQLLGSVSFIKELELSGASSECLKEFIEVKRQVRKELEDKLYSIDWI